VYLPQPWAFSAFESSSAFDRVVLDAPYCGYLKLDNLRFELVPELLAVSTISLVALFSVLFAVLALLVLHRRRQPAA
jgi:hypothetical protein